MAGAESLLNVPRSPTEGRVFHMRDENASKQGRLLLLGEAITRMHRMFETYVRGFPGLLVGRLFSVLVVLVVGVAGAEMTDVTFTGLEVSVTAVALEQRRRLGDLGGDVEFVLVPVPTGSRR